MTKSLRGQLTRAAMLTMLLATLMSASALLAYELLTYRTAWADDLRTQADLIARASAAAIVFNDPAVAQENLALLRARPSISAAAIYSSAGPLFSNYLRSNEERLPVRLPPALQPGKASFNGQDVEIAYSIEHDGQQLGMLYLRAEHDIWARLRNYALILGAIVLASVGFSYSVFDRLQNRVTTPLVRMTEVAQEVITSRNWKLRAPDTDYQDVRVLVDAFNGMLTECGHRTSELESEIAIREKAEQELRWADRRKDEFLATLAHELRNPLAPIMSAVGLMETSTLPEDKRRKAVAVVGRQVRHMVRLINDLLDASRIATGKLSLERRPVDIVTLAKASVELAEPLAVQHGLNLSVSLPSKELHVDGDAVRLSQVFSNLLNNACRYTPPGGSVHVSCAQDGADVILSVRDTGIGVAAEMQARIFDLFEQADKSLERGNSGLGIGLTLSRQLIELHHGTVTMTSEGHGRGSCFTVRLPVMDHGIASPGSPSEMLNDTF